MTAEEYKNTLKCFASGVTILSWRDEHSAIQGITVSAFSALSLDPPLVLFCIAHDAYIYPQLSQQNTIAVNILADGQKDLAYQFAGGNRENLEQHLSADNPHQLPYLKGAHANLSVQIEQKIPAGDHDIFIARLLCSETSPERLPLIYHNGKL